MVRAKKRCHAKIRKIPRWPSGGDPPVPIPNTEVKPSSADNTARFLVGKIGRRRGGFILSTPIRNPIQQSPYPGALSYSHDPGRRSRPQLVNAAVPLRPSKNRYSPIVDGWCAPSEGLALAPGSPHQRLDLIPQHRQQRLDRLGVDYWRAEAPFNRRHDLPIPPLNLGKT